ncbi:MAG: hypothetical protein NC331_10110 [Lachnospiraceae bacterium]|nr:hypothetical protein [Lachnospiraceae bacterium]MCM1239725.1 hypothetical protein [Lachnospiraceae bacterium]
MSLTNEDLLSISNIVKAQIEPMERRTINMELLLENDIIPRLQNIEACYTSTFRRYANRTEQVDAIQSDVDIISPREYPALPLSYP